MARESKYFPLSLESLRALGSWAADCAERALPVYEKHADSDSRPRAAIEGIRVFAAGGRRTAQLLHVRQTIPLQQQPLAPPALQPRALTRIHWRMFNKRNILSVPQPMPHWHLSSTAAAIQASVMVRFVGQSNTLPLKCAKSCYTCPLVKPETVAWTQFSISWMRASAVGACRETPDKAWS
jgi:hypothetical protein